MWDIINKKSGKKKKIWTWNLIKNVSLHCWIIHSEVCCIINKCLQSLQKILVMLNNENGISEQEENIIIAEVFKTLKFSIKLDLKILINTFSNWFFFTDNNQRHFRNYIEIFKGLLMLIKVLYQQICFSFNFHEIFCRICNYITHFHCVCVCEYLFTYAYV